MKTVLELKGQKWILVLSLCEFFLRSALALTPKNKPSLMGVSFTDIDRAFHLRSVMWLTILTYTQSQSTYTHKLRNQNKPKSHYQRRTNNMIHTTYLLN